MTSGASSACGCSYESVGEASGDPLYSWNRVSPERVEVNVRTMPYVVAMSRLCVRHLFSD